VSDGYDDAGRLTKVWLNMYSPRFQVRSSISGAPHEERLDNPAAVLIDVPQRLATRLTVPSAHDGSTAWQFNLGEAAGVTPDFFTIARMIDFGLSASATQ
jgi:hypothetical protein